MLALTWVATVAGVVAAVFAVLAWSQTRGGPDWELHPTREPERWRLRRVGRAKAHVFTLFNHRGAQVTVEHDLRGEGIHDLSSGTELVLTVEHVVPGTHMIVMWTERWQRQWPRVWRRRELVWSAPLY